MAPLRRNGESLIPAQAVFVSPLDCVYLLFKYTNFSRVELFIIFKVFLVCFLLLEEQGQKIFAVLANKIVDIEGEEWIMKFNIQVR